MLEILQEVKIHHPGRLLACLKCNFCSQPREAFAFLHRNLSGVGSGLWSKYSGACFLSKSYIFLTEVFHPCIKASALQGALSV